MSSARDPPAAKIGDQTVKAMMSLGLEEVRNLIHPNSNVAQQSTEPGIWGERSYGDVAEDREELDEQSKSILLDKIKQVEAAHGGREREPQEISKERE